MENLHEIRIENPSLDYRIPGFFSNFRKIQVIPQRFYVDEDFKSMNVHKKQELVNRLIDRVKEL